MMRHTFPFRPEREARLLHELAGMSGAELPKDAENKNVIETMPEDMRSMFRYFAEVPSVTAADLNTYFAVEKEGELTPAESDIKKNLDLLSGMVPGTPVEQAEASRKIETVLADINTRNKVIAENKAKLRDFEATHENIPSVQRTTYETGKKIVSTTAEAFAKSDWKDRGMMLGGLLAGFLIMRALWQRMPGTGKLKKFAFLIGGGLLTVAAFESFNRATEKVTGRPFMSTDRAGKIKDNLQPGVVNTADALLNAGKKSAQELGRDLSNVPEATRAAIDGNKRPAQEVLGKLGTVEPSTAGALGDVKREAGKAMPGAKEAGKEAGHMLPVFSDSNQEWDARKRSMELKELEETFDEIDFPDDFIAQIDEVKAPMAPTVATVALMGVEEFLAVYEMGRVNHAIDAIPSRKLPKDGLTPQQRFVVIEDIAKTLNLVDRGTGELLPLHKERQGASMFFLMMDWKHIPGNEEEKKDEE